MEKTKLITSSGTGSTFITLKKRDKIPIHTSVIVTPIDSLFVENTNGAIKLAKGQDKRMKFFVLDSYGRVFFNNLINIEY